MKHYEFGYNTKEFERVRVLAKKLSGIEIEPSKMDMIYTRLVRIIRTSHFDTFTHYIDALEKGHSELEGHFINAITTNLTSFFREKHHFELLTNTALPEILKQKKADKTVKVWSAACSTGEEPYSLAFTLDKFFSIKPAWHYKLYASDIDTNVLNKAQKGIYNLDTIKDISPQEIGRWFYKGVGPNEGLCKVKPHYQEAINFFQCNLVEPLLFDWTFDIIFCRNVLIYFDHQTQLHILEQLMAHLNPNGFIFTGHSESFMYHYKKTKLVAKTMYRKL